MASAWGTNVVRISDATWDGMQETTATLGLGSGPTWDNYESAWYDQGASGLYSYDDGASWEPKRPTYTPPPVSTAGALASLENQPGSYSLTGSGFNNFNINTLTPPDAETDGLGHWWDSSVQAWRNDDGSLYDPLQSAPPPVSTQGALDYLDTFPSNRASFADYDLANQGDPALSPGFEPQYGQPWSANAAPPEAGGGGLMQGFTNALGDLAEPFTLPYQAANALADRYTGTTQGERLNSNVSGNQIADIASGGKVDLWDLPYGAGYVTDMLNPATLLTAGLGPSVPLIGSTFGGSFGARLAGEIGVGALGYAGMEAGAKYAPEVIPNYEIPQLPEQITDMPIPGLMFGDKAIDAVNYFGKDEGQALLGAGAGALAGGLAGVGVAKALTSDTATGLAKALHSGESGAMKLGSAADDAGEALAGVAAKQGLPPLAPVQSLAQAVDDAPIGFGGADAVLKLKEDTIPRPGKIGQAIADLPGGSKVLGAFDPSRDMDRTVYVASLGQQAANADLATRFAATRGEMVKLIDEAFTPAPKYVGPDVNPIKGKFIDIAENPQDYVLDSRQKSILSQIEARDVTNVQLARSQYGVDIGLKKPATGGIYVPRVNANEDLVQQGIRTEQALASPKIAKERVWETARDRMVSDPAFLPETDIHKLFTIHDNAIAKAAGDSTFTRGVGGKSRMEVIEEIRPGLKETRERAASRLKSVRNQMDTALGKENRLAAKERTTLAQQRRIEDRMAPLEARIAELEAAGEFGPELSYLSGEARELRLQLAAASRVITGTPKQPGTAARMGMTDAKIRYLMGELDTAQDDLTRLAGQYKNINIPDRSGYTLSQQTYKYHPAEITNDIAKLKQDSLGPMDKAFTVAETSRQTALGADISPVTIQGQMNVWRDPVSAVIGMAKMAKDIVSGNGTGLARLAREEPEMVSRFVQAKGRALGSHMDEFGTDKSLIARIPKVGPAFTKANDAMFDGIARLEYEAWKNTTALIKKLNPSVSDDAIDYGVANALSKSVPSLNPAERGVSGARNKLERMFATSVSFATSPPLLMKDAASAVVKLGTGKPPAIKEQVALAHLFSIAATTTTASALSAGIYAQQNGLDVEAEIRKALNPANKEFMAIKLPNGMRIPIGGPFRSFVKAVTPIDRDGNLKQPDIYGWAENRIAPLPGAGLDLLQNADFEGNTLLKGSPLERTGRGIEYILEQAFLPITAGQVPAGIRQGKGAGEIVQDVISQGSGTNAQPPSVYDARDRTLANDASFEQYRIPNTTGPLTWDNLGALGRAEYVKKYGGIDPTSENARQSADMSAELLERQTASDTARTEGTLSPEQWRRDYTDRKTERYFRNDEIWKGTDFTPGADKVLNAYYAAIDAAEGPDGKVDWEKMDAYVAGLSEGDRKWIADNTGLVKISTPATEAFDKEYRKVKDSGWFDREDETWSGIAGTLGLPYQHYDDWAKAKREQAYSTLGVTTEDQKVAYSAEVEKFVNQDPIAKAMTERSAAWRKEYAIHNPEAAFIAWKYGYWGQPPAEVRNYIRGALGK